MLGLYLVGSRVMLPSPVVFPSLGFLAQVCGPGRDTSLPLDHIHQVQQALPELLQEISVPHCRLRACDRPWSGVDLCFHLSAVVSRVQPVFLEHFGP